MSPQETIMDKRINGINVRIICAALTIIGAGATGWLSQQRAEDRRFEQIMEVVTEYKIKNAQQDIYIENEQSNYKNHDNRILILENWRLALMQSAQIK